MGLQFGGHTPRLAAPPPPNGGNCIIRAATRRRYAASQLLMLQIPHHSQPEVRHIAYRTWRSTGWRKTLAQRRPSTGISAKNFAQQVQKRRIWAILSALGELFALTPTIRPSRAKNIAHQERQRGDIETNNTTARPQQGTAETVITTATEKCTKNARFSPAKATPVSVEARPAPAKVTSVSNPRKHARAKATWVSDYRAAWSTGPGRGARLGFEARCRRDWWARLRRPWAAAGPGRASRSTTPSRRLACGDLAGGPPPTGAPSSPAPPAHTKTPTRGRVGVSEPPVGIEPTTYSLRVNRSAD